MGLILNDSIRKMFFQRRAEKIRPALAEKLHGGLVSDASCLWIVKDCHFVEFRCPHLGRFNDLFAARRHFEARSE